MRTIFVIVLIGCLSSLEGYNAAKKPYSRLNFFDTDLLRYTIENSKENIMVSPASVKSVLAMILEGAEGQTAAEISSALRVSPGKEEFRDELNIYLRSLKTNFKGTQLQNTNALFASHRVKLVKEYETLAKKVYLSEVNKVDFRYPGTAAEAINSWVNKSTKGLIPSIVEPAIITPATDMFVTNALYFKSSWQSAFNPQHTRSACFYVQGACTDIAMMTLQAELKYAYVDDLRAHAVELPYEGGRYAMTLLVPREMDGLNDLLRDLPYMTLPHVLGLLEPTDMQLSMPKFTVECGTDMVQPLKKMKVTTLFSKGANLTGMIEGHNAHINGFHHKVYLSVDEKGTVAAAASTAVVIPLIQSGVQIRVDRPFLFFIRDREQDIILFEGMIVKPMAFVEPNAPSDINDQQPQAGKPPQRVQSPGVNTQKVQSQGFDMGINTQNVQNQGMNTQRFQSQGMKIPIRVQGTPNSQQTNKRLQVPQAQPTKDTQTYDYYI